MGYMKIEPHIWKLLLKGTFSILGWTQTWKIELVAVFLVKLWRIHPCSPTSLMAVASAAIHIDLAGPFMGKTYHLVVNAHAKWPNIIQITSTTIQKTITELCKMFAAYGLLAQLVSDDGPQFTAEEFSSIMVLNISGVHHTIWLSMVLSNA